MTEVKFVKHIHPDSQTESLILPHNLTLAVFDHTNWSFYLASLAECQPGVVARVIGECKLAGYEDWVYEWEAVEKDIMEYGGGTEEGWKEYVEVSFYQGLDLNREQYLERIKESVKSAMNLSE